MYRNLKRSVGELVVALLGDQHLGKSFQIGTPLARRGDREKMQWADFEASLNDVENVDVHVNMGDMFDKAIVPYTVVYWAAMIYKRAARAHPTVQYYLLAGNHDLSRDLERVSAFLIFAAICSGIPNLHVVKDACEVYHCANTKLVFVPWDPVLNAQQMVERDVGDVQGADAVFGHWDVVEIGQSENLLPAAKFVALGVKEAITGHDHTRRNMVMRTLPVLVTGSMQPYSFAEDPDNDLYITCSLLELESFRPEFLKNKCVRVILDKGEHVQQIPDCLQFRTKYIGQADEDDVEIAVTLGDFSFDKIFDEVMTEAGIEPSFITLTKDRIEAERVKQ